MFTKHKTYASTVEDENQEWWADNEDQLCSSACQSSLSRTAPHPQQRSSSCRLRRPSCHNPSCSLRANKEACRSHKLSGHILRCELRQPMPPSVPTPLPRSTLQLAVASAAACTCYHWCLCLPCQSHHLCATRIATAAHAATPRHHILHHAPLLMYSALLYHTWKREGDWEVEVGDGERREVADGSTLRIQQHH